MFRHWSAVPDVPGYPPAFFGLLFLAATLLVCCSWLLPSWSAVPDVPAATLLPLLVCCSWIAVVGLLFLMFLLLLLLSVPGCYPPDVVGLLFLLSIPGCYPPDVVGLMFLLLPSCRCLLFLMFLLLPSCRRWS